MGGGVFLYCHSNLRRRRQLLKPIILCSPPYFFPEVVVTVSNGWYCGACKMVARLTTQLLLLLLQGQLLLKHEAGKKLDNYHCWWWSHSREVLKKWSCWTFILWNKQRIWIYGTEWNKYLQMFLTLVKECFEFLKDPIKTTVNHYEILHC